MVDAFVSGIETLPARFVLESVGRDPAQPTSFSGIVQNNNGEPIQGVICEIEVNGLLAGETVSNADGIFSFSGIPDGPAHLRVDGFPATAAGGLSVPQGTFLSLPPKATSRTLTSPFHWGQSTPSRSLSTHRSSIPIRR